MLKLLRIRNFTNFGSGISTSASVAAVQSGRFKVSIKHNNPLTYEQAHKPHDIGAKKEWNSFNTGEVLIFLNLLRWPEPGFPKLTCFPLVSLLQTYHTRIR